MERNLTCIICPRGCQLTVKIDGDKTTVSGHSCPKGLQYGIDEVSAPMRTITSAVRVSNRHDTMVSVKTANPIPKDKIFELMDVIRTSSVDAPVRAGSKIIKKICGTDIIATCNID